MRSHLTLAWGHPGLALVRLFECGLIAVLQGDGINLAHLWLAGLSIILVSEGSEADDFSPQPGTLNIGEYEPGTIALAAMGTGLCT